MYSLRNYFRLRDLYRYSKQLEYKLINQQKILRNYYKISDQHHKTQLIKKCLD
jgi:hypothetical protein